MAYNKGERLGDYEIVDVLGAGGMGKVYKVRNVISDRVEAMKVLLPNLESDPDLADRFMREIKVQASLQHPNIAALHTALRVNNQLLMLIEFVEGVTIEQQLRSGPIPVQKAVDYIGQVLQALGYAHSRGVVHRDIKPANIMLMPNGSVKLMDFGIARLSADRRLTQTGRTVGSLYYMSPEQIQGALDLDARSDLYSLGVSLYEMVTARRPFMGDSDYSIMAAHLSARPVPPIEVDPSLPSALNDVILMAIAKEPAQRFQTADAFRMALQSVTAGARGLPSSATKVVAGGMAPAGAAPARQMPPPAAQPAVAPAQASGSKRGLYMAIGSVVTVAVLAFAALQAPKLFKPSEAAESQLATPAAQAPPPHTAPPSVEQQPQATAPAPSAPPAPAVQTPSPVPERTVQSSQRIVQTQAPVAAAPQRMAQPAPAVQQSTATQQPIAQQPPPATAPVQQQPAAQAQAPAAQASGSAEDVRLAREMLMMLGTRANSVKASLNSMKEQQARMGTNLRGDILTAEQRMEFYLDDAQLAIRSGEAKKARTSLESAERALETIEKFLGR